MEQKFIDDFKEVLEIDEKEVDLMDKFREYPEWGSLALMSLIAMLDDEFGVEIELDDFNKLITINDLLTEIKTRSLTQ